MILKGDSTTVVCTDVPEFIMGATLERVSTYFVHIDNIVLPEMEIIDDYDFGKSKNANIFAI